MPASKNSKTLRSSKKPARKSVVSAQTAHWFAMISAFLLLAGLGVGAAAWFYKNGYICYYGDAEAHLNIARRILDSRTPGRDQIRTVRLPLPHLLMLPFVANTRLWETGLAGTIPSVLCFVTAGMFLFAAAHRVFGSLAAAA